MRCNHYYILIGLISFLVLQACNHSSWDTDSDQFTDQLSFSTQIASKGANLDNSNLSSFGVFAFYTGQNSWESVSATILPNYLYNQEVKRQKQGDEWSAWTYSPVMYWPKAEEKLSFFAYAPFATPENGIKISSKTHTGPFTLTYRVPVEVKNQQDILYTLPLLDQSKDSYLNKNIPLNFKHALTKIIFHAKIQDGKEPPAGQYLKIKSVSIKNISSGGTLNFQTTPVLSARWSVQEGPLQDYILTTQPEGGLTDCNLGNIPVSITSPEGQLNLMPQTISQAALLSVQYALTDQNGNETEILVSEHLFSSLMSELQMGKGILFTIQLGVNAPGIISASVLPWEEANVEGDFSATYLNVSRTNITEFQQNPITIYYETDYPNEVIISPVNTYVYPDHLQKGVISFRADSFSPGLYKYVLRAGGIYRIINITIR